MTFLVSQYLGPLAPFIHSSNLPEAGAYVGSKAAGVAQTRFVTQRSSQSAQEGHRAITRCDSAQCDRRGQWVGGGGESRLPGGGMRTSQGFPVGRKASAG